MNVDLQLTSLDTNPASPNYSGDAYIRLLEDSQGNILKSHGRDFGAHLFLKFDSTGIAGARKWLATTLAPQLTSGWVQLQQTRQFRATGKSDVFITAALSADGYRALGFSDAQLPDDPSFLRGAVTAASRSTFRPGCRCGAASTSTCPAWGFSVRSDHTTASQLNYRGASHDFDRRQVEHPAGQA